MSRLRGITIAGAVALALTAASPAGAGAANPLELGFSDPLFQSPDPALRAAWLDRATDAQAGTVKMFVTWAGIAGPSEPASPRDPADPSYTFDGLDAAVEDATARGFEVLLGIQGAPAWAEGNDRPQSATPGTWKPQPAKVADFMAAVASRYSGSFDGLPRVRFLQLWNEVNLSEHLNPQWVRKEQVAAIHYRRMLNATYTALQSTGSQTLLVTAGLAPYGDQPGGDRTRPLRFWRDVFCLTDRKRPKKLKGCKGKARFDVFAHHAINTSGSPRRSAIHPDDASSGDLGQVRKTLRAAERGGTAPGAKRHPLWVTEMWWASNPPDGAGFSLSKQARYIQETFYLAWRAGFSRAIQLRIRDGDPAVFGRYADGIYFIDGERKPSVGAFRFPFVADRRGNKVVLWGKAPGSGRVVVERKRGKRWKRVARLRAGENRIFTGARRLRGEQELRARQAETTSRVWRLGP